MKINLDDAYKRATPGPHWATGISVFVPAEDGDGCRIVLNACQPLACADAALAAHCLRNFAEAVALLKQASDNLSQCEYHATGLSPKIDAAIKRFETVEVP